MKKLILILALGAMVAPTSWVLAATVPCEDMLKDVRASEASATLNDADKAAVADLEAKGVERCNADDDKRADEFFAQAMKVMGK